MGGGRWAHEDTFREERTSEGSWGHFQRVENLRGQMSSPTHCLWAYLRFAKGMAATVTTDGNGRAM